MSSEEKRKTDEWCRMFVEIIIQERQNPFDQWAYLIGVFRSLKPNEIIFYSEDGELLSEDKLDFVYQGRVNGEQKEFYFTLTKSEYDIFKNASSKTPLRNIKFLTVLNSILGKSQKNAESLERSWINNEILIQTPSLEFKSLGQMRILRKKMEEIADQVENINILDRFDNLIRHKSYVSHDLKANEDWGSSISKNAMPAEIIRHVMQLIKKFNKRYDNKDQELIPKLWINFLFMGTPGFSLEHIQKSLQRKK